MPDQEQSSNSYVVQPAFDMGKHVYAKSANRTENGNVML